MFDAFTNYSFPGERARAIEVFLDTKRLVQGRRFDFDFVKAICHSKLVMPILSYAALELMSNHNPEKVDNMLLEWILAMECFQVEQGALKGIFPLTIGERKGDSIEGKTATKFLSAKALNLLPHVVPTKTLQEAEIHLQKFGLFVADAAAREKFHARNVYEIVDSLMKFLYFDISSLSPNFVVAESTQKAVSTLEVLCRNSSVMEEKPISHEIVASIVERSIKPQPGLDKVEEDAWKILTNKLCHSLADEDFVQSRLHDLGIYESKMILKLSDKLIDDITSSLKPVPQKKTIAYLKMLKDFPSSTVDSNSDDQLNEIWRLMTDDRFIVSGKASEVAEILDEQGVVDASFLSDLDEDILSQIASKLKAVPCFKVITALLPPK